MCARKCLNVRYPYPYRALAARYRDSYRPSCVRAGAPGPAREPATGGRAAVPRPGGKSGIRRENLSDKGLISIARRSLWEARGGSGRGGARPTRPIHPNDAFFYLTVAGREALPRALTFLPVRSGPHSGGAVHRSEERHRKPKQVAQLAPMRYPPSPAGCVGRVGRAAPRPEPPRTSQSDRRAALASASN